MSETADMEAYNTLETLTVRIPNLMGAVLYQFAECKPGVWVSAQTAYQYSGPPQADGESREAYVERCAHTIYDDLVWNEELG